MSRRFTDRQLFQVRNHIPIRHVIETLLAIPSETVEGVFRFRCPLCAGRHTAVKPETNLSRCFHCGRNFNAIDLCMLVRHMNFVESVTFLMAHQGRLPPAESTSTSPKFIIDREPKNASRNMPVAMNEILAGLIGNGFRERASTAGKATPRKPAPPNEITELERMVNDLSQILQRLKASHKLK